MHPITYVPTTNDLSQFFSRAGYAGRRPDARVFKGKLFSFDSSDIGKQQCLTIISPLTFLSFCHVFCPHVFSSVGMVTTSEFRMQQFNAAITQTQELPTLCQKVHYTHSTNQLSANIVRDYTSLAVDAT